MYLQSELEQVSAQLEQADNKNIHLTQKNSSLEAMYAESQVNFVLYVRLLMKCTCRYQTWFSL